MNNKLIQLALLLESEGMIEEAKATFDLISLGNNTELSQWQAAWDSVSQPIPKQFPGRALKFMIDGIKDMAAAGEALQGVDPDDLADAGKAIKRLSRNQALDADTLKKFSKIGIDPKITKEAFFMTSATID